MSQSDKPVVKVVESGNGPYGQMITIGRHTLFADEPQWMGGEDTGPTPQEFLLAALGACTAVTLRMYARRHHWPLERVSVDLRRKEVAAEEEGNGKSRWVDQFERVIQLTGDLSPSQRACLLEIADRCPVSRTLKQGCLVIPSALSDGGKVVAFPKEPNGPTPA